MVGGVQEGYWSWGLLSPRFEAEYDPVRGGTIVTATGWGAGEATVVIADKVRYLQPATVVRELADDLAWRLYEAWVAVRGEHA